MAAPARSASSSSSAPFSEATGAPFAVVAIAALAARAAVALSPEGGAPSLGRQRNVAPFGGGTSTRFLGADDRSTTLCSADVGLPGDPSARDALPVLHRKI